ncbi:hypothetical protein PC129_g10791 [Phytophthora cactorum]|uniref:Uncharacterized protein n=1 Tax=Phytophthora cactorum TaxID=29920 RepID=A0A8T1I0M5_9STRA|nr:hypothetical protein Pcac1_g7251 [Phytophthora cactorum]KAG2805653.1 hypothetical protein PC111_g17711 [Phytophthora cactorum]KAG2856813.1 hypothetical protein PC113_g11246 [Phytophthora cactorum]KAG2907792.1 hypothetical protein PC114_g10714 [Phytophthora cactorum]KAG2918400.1 hypothetical protein PC115_g10456 [Phytophthora cactorum]
MLSSEDYASIIKSVAVDLGVAPTDSTLHCNVSWYCKGLDIRDTMRNDTKDARNAAIAKMYVNSLATTPSNTKPFDFEGVQWPHGRDILV